MRLSVSMPAGLGGDPRALARRVQDLERAGLDMVWVGEGYGFDVPTTLGFLAAVTERVQLGSGILNVFSRTPAALAQTAAGLDWLTGGRAALGLGSSGPQVMEGFHGVPFDRPVQRTLEIIDICRAVWRREPVRYDGEVFTLPLPPEAGGAGVGKPIKLVAKPVRDRIPIWWGSLGPRSVEETAARCEGWLTFQFHPERARSVWGEALARGQGRRDPSLPPLEIQAGGKVAIGDDVDVQAIVDGQRQWIALYVGGMGARGKNFYNDLAVAYGYEREAALIQDLFLAGRRDEAAAAVPTDWLEAMTIAGPEGRVRERLHAYKEAGVTALTVDVVGDDVVRTVEHLRALVDTL